MLTAAMVFGLVGCSDGGDGTHAESPPSRVSRSASQAGNADPGTPTTPPTTATKSSPSPTATESVPGGDDVLDAYRAYTRELQLAQEHPNAPGNTAAIKRVALDPEQAEDFKSITELQEDGLAWEGPRDQARARVISVSLDAKPYPVGVVRDCPRLSKSRQLVYANSGKVVQSVPTKSNDTPPPYAITATIVKYQGRWAVQKTSADKKQTCKP